MIVTVCDRNGNKYKYK